MVEVRHRHAQAAGEGVLGAVVGMLGPGEVAEPAGGAMQPASVLAEAGEKRSPSPPARLWLAAMPLAAAISGSMRGSGGNRPAAYPSRSPNAEKTIRSGRPAAISRRRISAARGTSSRRFRLIEVIRSSDRRDWPAMTSRKPSAGRRAIVYSWMMCSG
jgi:hypothetical protein